MIGVTGFQQLLDDLLVTTKALGLLERSLLIFQPQPSHAFQNGIDRLNRRPLQVGVFYPQDERPAVFAGVKPGKKRRACSANVKVACGAGCESCAYAHGLVRFVDAEWGIS